ncbi:MAG: ABC transporter permease [Blastocatellia bacterium]|nr:ABC transporter permease [Blastocatellia bacterium]
MKTYFKLFRQFILRAIARDRARSVITVLGISLGVGVMLAIRLANATSLDAFRAATESIAGETSVQITGATGHFDEMMLSRMEWLRRYGQPSPVITGYARAESGEFLQVMGVDILRDRGLRRYRLLRLNADESEPTARRFLLLLTDPESIILTEKFARPRGLEIGSRISLTMGDARREFTVRGLLLDEGPARALDGNFALMDIAAAQWAFNRLGRLDRLDIKLAPGLDADQIEAEIAARLPAGLQVARPEEQYGQVERMIAAFHFNLNALGSIALLVGLFLIYNTVSISVITRREEVGTLRALGTSRSMVLALFLGEALLMAIIGAGVGIGLGRLMASAAVLATSTTVETFYIATVATESASRHSVGLLEVLLAFGVALPLALFAAAVPALEASRVRPVEAMRGAERLAESFKPSRKYLIVSAALFALGYALSRMDAMNGLPVPGYLAALALMFGGAFLAPNALWLACRASRKLAARSFRGLQVEGLLASANLGGAIPRVSISVAALAVSLGMMIAISIMIGSFRETVSYWVDQTLKADIYARPLVRTRATGEGDIAERSIAAIKADPDVAAIDSFTSHQAVYQGNPITMGAGDFDVLLAHGRLAFKSPADARSRLKQSIGRDAVVVSESFSLRFKKQPGDRVEMETEAGAREFEVAAVYYDYSNNRGIAVMDRATYERHFGRAQPGSLSIYLRPGADAEAVKERLARSIGSEHMLLFRTNASVRREVIRIFDSTFAITYALEAIAITVAGLGVLSTLIALILERRRELSVLNFLGATRGRIRRMIVIEAVLIGTVSQAIGILTGVMLSLVLAYVINVQSFGWTIQYHLPVAFLIQSSLLILAVTALAGLYPAARALKINALRFVREE